MFGSLCQFFEELRFGCHNICSWDLGLLNDGGRSQILGTGNSEQCGFGFTPHKPNDCKLENC